VASLKAGENCKLKSPKVISYSFICKIRMKLAETICLIADISCQFRAVRNNGIMIKVGYIRITRCLSTRYKTG